MAIDTLPVVAELRVRRTETEKAIAERLTPIFDQLEFSVVVTPALLKEYDVFQKLGAVFVNFDRLLTERPNRGMSRESRIVQQCVEVYAISIAINNMLDRAELHLISQAVCLLMRGFKTPFSSAKAYVVSDRLLGRSSEYGTWEHLIEIGIPTVLSEDPGLDPLALISQIKVIRALSEGPPIPEADVILNVPQEDEE